MDRLGGFDRPGGFTRAGPRAATGVTGRGALGVCSCSRNPCGVWPRGVARLADDPWAAALVAQHAITVYDRFRSDPAWASFFPAMEALRDQMLTPTRLPLQDLLADYVFVRLGDLISLTFSTGWTDEQRFADWSVRRNGAHVVVTPDPFGGVIITDWYSPPETPGERFKINVYILDTVLRADGVKVAVFRQTNGTDAGWLDAAVDSNTATAIEDNILTRARELRIAAINTR